MGSGFETINETNFSLKPKMIYRRIFEVVEVVGVILGSDKLNRITNDIKEYLILRIWTRIQ